MAKSASYYNVDDFNAYKRKQEKCLPPRVNVLAAANHIQALFDAKKFTWGFMGGLSMLCLGYKREMPDLHIAYDDKDFERLKSKLESDQRVRLPTGVNPLLPFKILVWTGPAYKDQGCTINASIELNLAPSGSCGTPTAGALARSLILVGLKTSVGQQMTFKSLNIRYLMASMLAYCKALDLLWDPRKDILYLCKSDTVEVQRIRSQLNTQEVKELFLGTSLFSRLPTEDQRLCYRTLLDTEPPPIMAITPPAPQIPTPVRQELRVSEKDSDTRAPRSRYRNASGQRNSSSGKSDHQATQNARPQSMDHLQDLRRLPHIKGIQCVNFAKPQSVSAVTATRRARKSMPNLMAAHNTAPVLHASAQDTRKTTNELVQHHEMPHVTHAPSQPSSTSSQQTHTSSQLKYGGSFKPVHIRAKNDTQDTNEGFSLGQRTLESRTGFTRTDSTGTPVQGIQSQKGSLHVVSPEGDEVPCQQYFQGESAPLRGRLHLVGSEGTHGGLEKHQHIIQPQAQHQRHQYAPPTQTESAFVFELDGTAPSQAAFIAELPANSIVASPVEQRTSQDHTASNGQATIRPPNPRTKSAPLGLESLPASLVAGGPGIHVHRQSLSHPETSDEPVLDFSTRQTNAYRYSSYAFPQSTNSDSLHAASEEATTSTYKAYRPFVVTEELSRTDSVSSVYSPGHKRYTSSDSTASHDSSKLAKEYQGLLNFEEGYRSD